MTDSITITESGPIEAVEMPLVKVPKQQMATTTERLHPSAAGKLLKWSPKKFRHWLDTDRSPSKGMVAGTILHTFMLGGKDIVLVDAPALRTKAAKEEWARAIDSGKTPLLTADFEEYGNASAGAFGAFQDRFGVTPAECVSETAIEWATPSGVLCKGTPDLVVKRDGGVTIVEVKATGDIAEFGRALAAGEYGVQAAAYMQAVSSQTDEFVDHCFLVVEMKAPYCKRWMTLDGMGFVVGENKWRYVSDLWGDCLAADNWPDYEPTVIETKGYEIAEWVK